MDVNTLTLLIVIPLGIAIINIILPVLLRKVITMGSLLLTLYLAVQLYFDPADDIMMFGQDILQTDQLSMFALIFIQILSLIILMFSLKGIHPDRQKAFFVWYPMTVSFCNGVVLSDHSISFILFWGLSGLTLYMFSLLGNTKETPQTAKKTFILIGGSDAFLILGLAMMGFAQPEALWSLDAFNVPLSNGNAVFAFILLLVAAFTKAGGFPFHTWVPDFSRDAQVEGAAFLPASLDKILGIYLLARMMMTLFVYDIIVNLIVVTLGALTVITAVMMAMNQHNGRKLLGYHAVSQVGYMIMGVGSGSVIAFAGGLFHLVNHTLYKSNLFLSLGSVEKRTGTNDLEELGGLGKAMPVTLIMALVGALSISGIPPFNGFFSKWMIYQGLLEKTATLAPGYQLWLLLCIILAIFGSALTLASFMKFIHAIFLGRPREKYAGIKEAPANQWIATGILSLACILLGIFAVEIPLRQLIFPVLEQFNMPIPDFPGLYHPQLIVILFLVAGAIGYLLYLVVRKVRYDDVYLGGMAASEKFRISGTSFYNEIRMMSPLKSIYSAAEKKWFDMYSFGGNATFALSRIFQRAHPGQLQLYILYIIIGVLVFLWMIR